MKPKKKEKERKLPVAEENTQADLEAFLQAFESMIKVDFLSKNDLFVYKSKEKISTVTSIRPITQTKIVSVVLLFCLVN